jgi:hypothetical protein
MFQAVLRDSAYAELLLVFLYGDIVDDPLEIVDHPNPLHTFFIISFCSEHIIVKTCGFVVIKA